MASRRRHVIGLLLLGLATAGTLLHRPSAARAEPNMSELLSETQRQTNSQGRVRLVWWLPEEFWRLSMQSGAGMSKEAQEAFLKAVRPYLLLAAVDGVIGPLGGMEFVGQDSLRAELRVIDKRGGVHSALPEEQLTGDLRNLATLLHSTFGNMLGAAGQGTHLFFFPAQSADGSRIADPAAEGEFSVGLGEDSFRWRLPLGCLLPAKACPVDGERMSGAWRYCPWHGKILVQADEPGAVRGKR